MVALKHEVIGAKGDEISGSVTLGAFGISSFSGHRS
jgi:hypothetical protein